MTYGRTARRLCQDANGIYLRSRTAGLRLFRQSLQSALSAFFRCCCRPVSLDASDVVRAGCRRMVRKHVSLCQPSLRVGTPIHCFGIAPPMRFPFDLTSSSLFTAGFYNLGKPSPSLQHRFKHRRNLPCRLQSDLGFGPNLFENCRIMSEEQGWPRTASSNTMKCEVSEDNPGSLRQIEESDRTG